MGRTIRGPAWSTTDELLAALVERVDVTNYILLKIHSKKGTNIPPPKRIPRPGDKPATKQRRRMSPTGDVKRFFSGGVEVV